MDLTSHWIKQFGMNILTIWQSTKLNNNLFIVKNNKFRRYTYSIICWRPLFDVFNFTLHAVPAYLCDSIAFVLGKNRRYIIGFYSNG